MIWYYRTWILVLKWRSLTSSVCPGDSDPSSSNTISSSWPATSGQKWRNWVDQRSQLCSQRSQSCLVYICCQPVCPGRLRPIWMECWDYLQTSHGKCQHNTTHQPITTETSWCGKSMLRSDIWSKGKVNVEGGVMQTITEMAPTSAGSGACHELFKCQFGHRDIMSIHGYNLKYLSKGWRTMEKEVDSSARLAMLVEPLSLDILNNWGIVWCSFSFMLGKPSRDFCFSSSILAFSFPL